jgi:hypothetical protein
VRVLACLAAVAGALAVSNACYSPNLEDCQFKCGPGGSCPDGTSCMGGFCRNSTTGTCNGNDNDARGSSDASINCPAGVAPCTGTPVRLTSECAILCENQATPAEASAMCPPNTTGATGWHLAVVMTDTKRMEYRSKLGQSVGWIGLRHEVDGWHWQDPQADVLADNDPAWAGGEPSGITNAYGQLDTTAGPPELRTGSSTQQQKFFCEYVP